MKYITREDWLSRTIYMVETVMVRHGFVDETLDKRQPRPPAVEERRRWIRFLATLLGKQKPGVQFSGKTIP